MIYRTLHIFEYPQQGREFMRNRDPKEEHAVFLGEHLAGIGCKRIQFHCEFSSKHIKYITESVLTRLVP